jgi:uncharacterized repeat protein (TIGR02543 family)
VSPLDETTGTEAEILAKSEAKAWKRSYTEKSPGVKIYGPVEPADGKLLVTADGGYKDEEGTYDGIRIAAGDSKSSYDTASERGVIAKVVACGSIGTSARYVIVANDVEKTRAQFTGWNDEKLLGWAKVMVYDRLNDLDVVTNGGARQASNDPDYVIPQTVQNGAWKANYYVVSEPGTVAAPTNKVKVTDGIPPEIEYEPEMIEVSLGAILDPKLGLTITDYGVDKNDPTPTDQLDIRIDSSNVPVNNSAEMKTTEEGVFTIEYSVEDPDGNKDFATRVVIVNDGTIVVGDSYILKTNNSFDINVNEVMTRNPGKDMQLFERSNPVVWDMHGNIVENPNLVIVSDGNYTNVKNRYNVVIGIREDAKVTKVTEANVEAKTFVVTYNVNTDEANAQVWPKTQSFEEPNLEVTGVPNAALRGFTFKGWNTEPTGTGTSFSSPYTVKGDMTVYAQWEAIPVPEPGRAPTIAENIYNTIVEAITPEDTPTMAVPTTNIDPVEAPQSGFSAEWSLLNLLLSLFGIEILFFVMILVARRRGTKRDVLYKSKGWLLAVIATAIGNMVSFMCTEPAIDNQMVMTDSWTPLNAALFVLTIAMSVMAFRHRPEKTTGE